MELKTPAFRACFSQEKNNFVSLVNLATGTEYIRQAPRDPLVELYALADGQKKKLVAGQPQVSGDSEHLEICYAEFGGLDIRMTVHCHACLLSTSGCSRLGVFFRIVLPNAKPAIATTAILSFRNIWNSFLWPMLVLNDYDKLTLTVGLRYLKDWEPNWAVLLAGTTLSIVPIIIVFLIFQKQFMASTVNSGFGGT